jgi:hypothetical protein
MPLYSFSLRDCHRLDDFEATELLPKKNNLTAWNGWRVEVTDGDRQVWQIPFIWAGS